jgi:hypothetical protein
MGFAVSVSFGQPKETETATSFPFSSDTLRGRVDHRRDLSDVAQLRGAHAFGHDAGLQADDRTALQRGAAD